MARLHLDGRGVQGLPIGRGLLWLAILAGASIALIVLDQSHKLRGVENALSRAFTPAQTSLTTSANPVFDWWSTITQVAELRTENALLRGQIAALELEQTQLARAQAENETMRAQLKYAQASSRFTLLPATVIGKDLHGLNDYIEIDRGGLDGIQPRMTVVSPEGYLVGRILSVTEHRSRILIVTNPSSSVAAMIATEPNPAEDVVDGKIHGRLVMSNVPQTIKVSRGQDVLTSGLGGNFPKGLKIGQIATVKSGDVQLFQQADVAPYCDFGRLAAVEVITNNLPVP